MLAVTAQEAVSTGNYKRIRLLLIFVVDGKRMKGKTSGTKSNFRFRRSSFALVADSRRSAYSNL